MDSSSFEHLGAELTNDSPFGVDFSLSANDLEHEYALRIDQTFTLICKRYTVPRFSMLLYSP